jgi:hypothetical protein
MQDEEDHRYNQQHVNQASGDVEGYKSHDPRNQQQEEQNQENESHWFTSLFSSSLRGASFACPILRTARNAFSRHNWNSRCNSSSSSSLRDSTASAARLAKWRKNSFVSDLPRDDSP